MFDNKETLSKIYNIIDSHLQQAFDEVDQLPHSSGPAWDKEVSKHIKQVLGSDIAEMWEDYVD